MDEFPKFDLTGHLLPIACEHAEVKHEKLMRVGSYLDEYWRFKPGVGLVVPRYFPFELGNWADLLSAEATAYIAAAWENLKEVTARCFRSFEREYGMHIEYCRLPEDAVRLMQGMGFSALYGVPIVTNHAPEQPAIFSIPEIGRYKILEGFIRK